jgi:hypothetical protein
MGGPVSLQCFDDFRHEKHVVFGFVLGARFANHHKSCSLAPER